MTCEQMRRLSVEDDEKLRAPWDAHASECAPCRDWQAGQQALAGAVASWVAAAPAPPRELEAKVLASVAGELSPATLVHFPTPLVRLRWLAAAAVLVAAAGLFVVRGTIDTTPAISVAGNLVLEDALAAARDAEREHARAIAVLEQAATTTLARADDPTTSARDAALLLSFRQRLASLDDVIAEVEAYLDANPGLASARTALLAAYIDKTEILRDILALEDNPGV